MDDATRELLKPFIAQPTVVPISKEEDFVRLITENNIYENIEKIAKDWAMKDGIPTKIKN